MIEGFLIGCLCGVVLGNAMAAILYMSAKDDDK